MDDILIPGGVGESRTARMSMLAWHPKGAEPLNLFTHIRHRRADGVGPWSGEPDLIWRTTEFPANDTVGPGEIRLHHLDAPLERCMELVKDISDGNVLAIDDVEVAFDLEPRPRFHWAYRNHMGADDHSVNSPFSRHSAKVTEFWSFAPEPRDQWRRICESYVPSQLEGHLRGVGFRLDQRLDRVGNLMIAGAQDDIACELLNGRTHLILSHNPADRTDLPENAYFATVWSGDSDDDLLHQHFELAGRRTIVNIGSELDQIGFAVYRRIDGQCVDRWEVPLVREISIGLRFSAGQTINVRDSRRGTSNPVSLGDSRSVIRVGDEHVDSLDAKIRREVLGRRTWRRDRDARAERNLGRFEPDQTEEAIDYFLNLLGDVWRPEGTIYLADPYFLQRDRDNTNERIYSGMFAATRGQELRILCGGVNPHGWLSEYPSVLAGHVAVRSFTSKNGRGEDKPAFHDRYLIIPDKEIIITHSINGWHVHGVTFATLTYEVYEAQVQELWSLNIGDNSNGVHVREVK